MVYGYVNSDEILRLSRAVHESDPDADGPAYKVNLSERVVDVEPHPLVLELAAKHQDGPSAALAYMADGSESDAPALIRWMIAGGYKGLFETDAAFAAAHYGSSLDNYVEAGLETGDVEFPPGLTLSEFVNWDDVAYEAIEIEELFYSVAVDAGVYVFDVSIDIDRYRE